MTIQKFLKKFNNAGGDFSVFVGVEALNSATKILKMVLFNFWDSFRCFTKNWNRKTSNAVWIRTRFLLGEGTCYLLPSISFFHFLRARY